MQKMDKTIEMNKERKNQIEDVLKSSDLHRFATRHCLKEFSWERWRKELNKATRELMRKLEEVCDYMARYGR